MFLCIITIFYLPYFVIIHSFRYSITKAWKTVQQIVRFSTVSVGRFLDTYYRR